MNKEIYEIRKNETINADIDYLIVSNYSPLCEKFEEFNKIKNLFLIDSDGTWNKSRKYNNIDNIIVVEIDYSNNAVDYGIVRNYFSKLQISSDALICIDSTNLVLQIYSYIYAYLTDIVQCDKVWFIYHEAKVYKNPSTYNYHDGVISTVQLECFGETENKKKELIVYLIGFEGSLTEAIDRMKEPEKKIIINGFPSYLLSYKDISILNNTHLFSNTYSVDYCSASNPFQTYNKLQSIYKKYNDKYKITVAPCGSTPSCIGAVMFAAAIEDVNIIISRPEKYNFVKRIYENRWLYCC